MNGCPTFAYGKVITYNHIIYIFFVRTWALHRLGTQITITCRLELQAIQLKGKCASYAIGSQVPAMQG